MAAAKLKTSSSWLFPNSRMQTLDQTNKPLPEVSARSDAPQVAKAKKRLISCLHQQSMPYAQPCPSQQQAATAIGLWYTSSAHLLLLPHRLLPRHANLLIVRVIQHDIVQVRVLLAAGS